MKIHGRVIAEKIYADLKNDIAALKKNGITPHILIVLVGSDSASKMYIRQKVKKAEEIGIRTSLKRFPKNVSEKTLLTFLQNANKDTAIQGIIIQRPVPPQIDADKLKTAVLPDKDVDGFHPKSSFDPPLALAVMTILQ